MCDKNLQKNEIFQDQECIWINWKGPTNDIGQSWNSIWRGHYLEIDHYLEKLVSSSKHPQDEIYLPDMISKTWESFGRQCELNRYNKDIDTNLQSWVKGIAKNKFLQIYARERKRDTILKFLQDLPKDVIANLSKLVPKDDYIQEFWQELDKGCDNIEGGNYDINSISDMDRIVLIMTGGLLGTRKLKRPEIFSMTGLSLNQIDHRKERAILFLEKKLSQKISTIFLKEISHNYQASELYDSFEKQEIIIEKKEQFDCTEIENGLKLLFSRTSDYNKKANERKISSFKENKTIKNRIAFVLYFDIFSFELNFHISDIENLICIPLPEENFLTQKKVELLNYLNKD